MELELRPVEGADHQLWDKILDSSDQTTIFHTWDWLKIAERHSEFRLMPLIGFRGTEPVGLIPLFYGKQSITRMIFSPPPHLTIPYLGPVFYNFDTIKQHKKESIYIEFQKKLDEYLFSEMKADYVNIYLPPGLADPRPFGWAGYGIRPVYDYVIPLDLPEETLWNQLDKKLRTDISRGEKKGYIIEQGSQNELGIVYEMMEKRYHQQNKIVKVPKNYLTDIYSVYKDNIKVFIARYDGEIITGWIDLIYKGELISWIGNLKPLMKISPSPNDLCCWYGIKFAHMIGMKHYITAEAAGNKRLHEYYAKYNPRLRIRFEVKSASMRGAFLEKGYKTVYKPVVDWFAARKQ